MFAQSGVVVRPEMVFGLIFVSIVYLLLTFLFLRQSKFIELKLLALGLLTALLAVWCELLTVHEGASISVRPGAPGEISGVLVGGEAARVLGRIAFLLVLAGVAISILNQWNAPLLSPGRREEAIREHTV